MMVIVHEAPGFEDFEAEAVPGMHRVVDVDSRGPLSVVSDVATGEPYVVPARHVFTPEGLRYAREWAAKLHRSVFDVRVPDALAVRA